LRRRLPAKHEEDHALGLPAMPLRDLAGAGAALTVNRLTVETGKRRISGRFD
jgi:hypothetical protein